MSERVEQPTNTPTSKVAAAAVGGAVATLLAFILGQFGVELTAEASAAAATLLAFVFGYFTRETASPRVAEDRGLTLLEALVVLLVVAVAILAVVALT